MRTIIVGAGAFGRELFDWLAHAKQLELYNSFFVDDHRTGNASERHPQVISTLDKYQPTTDDMVYVSIGDPKARQVAVEKLRAKRELKFFQTPYFVHPTAIVARSAVISNGCILCPFTVVSANAYLDTFVHLNCYSSIGHDVAIGSYTTLSSHVDVTGWCRVGNGVFFGSGSRTIPKRTVYDGAVVGAGAVVCADVRAGTTVYAAPARRLR